MIRALSLTTAAALTLALVYPAATEAQSKVEVGMLNCNVSSGSGFVFGSTKELGCTFQRAGRDERYVGQISKYGLDIGQTQKGIMSWAVLAPTTKVKKGALSGNYGGVAGEATVGVGVSANALVGGSSNTIVLQPVSVGAQQGLNLAVGVASLTLTLVR